MPRCNTIIATRLLTYSICNSIITMRIQHYHTRATIKTPMPRRSLGLLPFRA